MIGSQFGWTASVGRAAIVLAGVGLLATVVAAWFHGEKGAQPARGHELALYAALTAIAAVGVYVVRDSTVGRAQIADQAEPTQASIAVLPFLDLSAEGNQAHFAEGIAEGILNVLARIPQLRVVARTSSFAFKDTNVRMDSIGKALAVAHVLEGSVRKDGNTIRITAKLVSTGPDQRVIWSQAYDRDLVSVFAVQDEITAVIVDSLRIRLGVLPMPQHESTPSVNAHEQYLLGLAAWRFRNEASLRKAASHFELAVKADSAYAHAHAGLALAYAILPLYSDASMTTLWPKGIASARRALQLDPRSAEAHAALSHIALYSNDAVTAEREASEAVRLAPNYATGHQWLAEALGALGRLRESRAAAQRAAELDPLSPAAAAAGPLEISGPPHEWPTRN